MGEVLSSPIDLDIRNSQHWGPAPQGAPDIDHRQRGVGAAIVLIQVDGLFKVGNGCREVSFGEPPVVFPPAQECFIGGSYAGFATRRRLFGGKSNSERKSIGDALRLRRIRRLSCPAATRRPKLTSESP